MEPSIYEELHLHEPPSLSCREHRGLKNVKKAPWIIDTDKTVADAVLIISVDMANEDADSDRL